MGWNPPTRNVLSLTSCYWETNSLSLPEPQRGSLYLVTGSCLSFLHWTKWIHWIPGLPPHLYMIYIFPALVAFPRTQQHAPLKIGPNAWSSNHLNLNFLVPFAVSSREDSTSSTQVHLGVALELPIMKAFLEKDEDWSVGMESNLNKLNQLVTHSILWFGAYLNLVTQGKSSSRFAWSGCFIKNMIHCEPVFWQNPTNGTFSQHCTNKHQRNAGNTMPFFHPCMLHWVSDFATTQPVTRSLRNWKKPSDRNSWVKW